VTGGVARLEAGRRLEKNVRKHESGGRRQAGDGGGRKPHPAKRHPLHRGTAGDSVDLDVRCRSRHLFGNRGHFFTSDYQTDSQRSTFNPLDRSGLSEPRIASTAARAAARTRRLGSSRETFSRSARLSRSFRSAIALAAPTIATSDWS